MNRILFFLIFILSTGICKAQNFRGQWKGGFIDKSISGDSWGGDRCDYVLDLDIKGNVVTGYSYTYFSDGGQKYYTICKLKGFADKRKKFIQVTETERTKTNIPAYISNSFQVHRLKWKKEGANEILEGNWEPAPGQSKANTGYGTTSLTKRQLTEISALAKKKNAKKDPESAPITSLSHPFTKPKQLPASVKPKNPSIAKTIVKAPVKPVVKVPLKPLVTDPPVTVKKDTLLKPSVITKVTVPSEVLIPSSFEKRNNAVLQTVVVDNPSVKIELYDNGEIDGDSISLFYNGKVLLAHRRLSDKPITLDLPVNNDDVNDLVMYADNLGTIPPNTALMIVRDGNKRYEVRITSDLQKSGTIRFIHKKDGGN